MILYKLFYLIFKTVETSILLEMLEITKDQKDQLTYSSTSKKAPHPGILTSKSKFLHYIILFHKKISYHLLILSMKQVTSMISFMNLLF